MEALRFDGTGWEYFKIWIVNVLLVIVTLGLYYPWAKVRNRRYFYANTLLDGRNFEYHATGKQLFVGYLIALVAFILFSTVQNISPDIAGWLILAFFLIMPWVIWRSLMFNLKMSSFSNVRFQFAGRLNKAYVNYFGLPLLFFIAIYAPFILLAIYAEDIASMIGPVSLTLAAVVYFATVIYLKALLTTKNTHYLFDNYRYGQGKFETRVQTKGFAIITMKTMAVAFLLIVLFVIMAGLGSTLLSQETLASFSLLMDLEQQDPEVIEQVMTGIGPLLFVGMYIAFLLIGLAVLAFSVSRQRLYIYNNTRLDGRMRFDSTLTARGFFSVMVTNFILIIVTLGLAMPWAKVRMARLMTQNTLVDTQGALDQYISQQQQNQSALGDQIGDAFDVNVDLAF